MKKKHLIYIMIGVLTFCLSKQSLAYQIGIHFEGQIYQSDPMDDVYDWSELNSFFKIGDKVEGNFYYQSDAEIVWMNSKPGASEVLYQTDGIEMFVHDFKAYAPTGELSIIDNFYGGGDQYALWADQPDNGVYGVGVSFPLWAIGFGMFDSTGAVFSNYSLPLSTPNLNDFDAYSQFILLHFVKDLSNPNDGQYIVQASMTDLKYINPVPEPATMLLLGAGLVGLVGFGRKRFKKK